MSPKRSFYEHRIFPWLNDKFTSDPTFERMRGEAVEAARGRVLEIGFGTGLNLAHYKPSVQAVVAVEPNEGMQARAAARIAATSFPVEVVTAIAERLPLAGASFDTAVSVLTLCTVSDPSQVLGELRRVLRDDGRLLLLEHGLSQEPGVMRWQNRLNRIQMTMACGCHLNRPIAELVRSHGFQFESLRQFFMPKVPRPHGWMTLGVAKKA